VSHIPPALARRLARLSARAHGFHRFAHHPLCPAYAAETVRIGRRTRLCRGCTAAALGGALGVALALAVRAPPAAALLAGAALLGPALLIAARPRGGGRTRGLRPPPAPSGDPSAAPSLPPRGGKLVTRAVPACAAAMIVAWGVRSASTLGLASSALALALTWLAVHAYRRRGPDRRPCDACPDRRRPSPCTGFAPIARREAAFARAAARLLRAVPPPPQMR